jgi:hypothetical protein
MVCLWVLEDGVTVHGTHRTNRFGLDLVHNQMFVSCSFDKIRQVSTYATRMGSINFNLWMLDSGA